MKAVFERVNYSFGQVTRGLYKTIIGPILYGKKDDYDAQRYWRDRFSKYGQSLKGPGHEGISEQENERAYAEAANTFIDVCSKAEIDFARTRILEIGCGTGFYTQILANLGAKNYLGVDITDVLFTELKQKFPGFKFLKKDITTDPIEEEFDLIVMIDVIEHIVKESKLNCAMETVKSCLSERGIFIIAPLMEEKRRELFYVNFWAIEDLKSRFYNYLFKEVVPFRNGYLTLVKKQFDRAL